MTLRCTFYSTPPFFLNLIHDVSTLDVVVASFATPFPPLGNELFVDVGILRSLVVVSFLIPVCREVRPSCVVALVAFLSVRHSRDKLVFFPFRALFRYRLLSKTVPLKIFWIFGRRVSVDVMRRLLATLTRHGLILSERIRF